MNIEVIRFDFGDDFTVGVMFIDDAFECFTMEDAKRDVKIDGVTCIPAGIYPLTLRKEGAMIKRYQAKFGAVHKGMLWLRDVENFKYVYFHIGNDAEDTNGCILVGEAYSKAARGFVGNSTRAYRNIYPRVMATLAEGQLVTVIVKDQF